MKKLGSVVLAGLGVALASIAIATPASADAGIKALAKQQCKEERIDDPREFENRFGGSGKAAMKRCIRYEKRDAKRDCKQERRYETNEFIAEYGGTDGKALKRCIVDELR